MAEVKSVSLQDEFEELEGVQLLRAEWKRSSSPFVLIRYAIRGELQPHGLSLDLDKKLILDEVKNETLDRKTLEAVNKKIREITPKIWDTIVKKRGLTVTYSPA
jgi:hypothetical protein